VHLTAIVHVIECRVVYTREAETLEESNKQVNCSVLGYQISERYILALGLCRTVKLAREQAALLLFWGFLVAGPLGYKSRSITCPLVARSRKGTTENLKTH
jgi:hypothetical protein